MAAALSVAAGSASATSLATTRSVPGTAHPTIAPIPVAVFGADDRRTPPRRLKGVADQIGLFFSNTARTVCTAFCVAPRVVATAAHCLAQKEGKPAHLSEFMFARGYDRRREFVHVEGFTTSSTAQSVLTGEFHHRIKPPIDAAHDWALVRLSSDACPHGGIPVTPLSTDDVIAASDAGRIFQLSYHRDWTQWRVAYSKPCFVSRDFNTVQWSTIAPDFMDADQMIFHQCDTGGASSGSPMLMTGPRGVSVVGINVGTYVQAKVLSEHGKVTMREQAETVANTAVSARAFAGRITTFRGAAILASGDPIRQLQRQLAAQNFYRARIDGSYGPILRAAIQGYERTNKLPVMGVPTVALLHRLTMQAQTGFGRIAPTSAHQHTPAPTNQ
ncbi:MAG: peptidoglycan-binding protein [Hyphomicrobiaceae bacterium]